MKIHTVHQPYRKKPFVARWYENGRMRNRFFAPAPAREEFIRYARLSQIRMDLWVAIPLHKQVRGATVRTNIPIDRWRAIG